MSSHRYLCYTLDTYVTWGIPSALQSQAERKSGRASLSATGRACLCPFPGDRSEITELKSK